MYRVEVAFGRGLRLDLKSKDIVLVVSDENGKLAGEYGVFDEREKIAIRATFVLDAQRAVAYAVASSVNVGRSVGETLRVVRALRSGRLCPADWQPGTEIEATDLKY